ncbi:MAG: tRNA (guanosine(37)-N1)-methyltransferase TrmD [Candidatus Taylorbacteria bacterium]|nr:tRNA (guanosine(37)-N1)-methyltransferase TrmD [Candidatus Taylorbacteria bacterium]
MTFHIITLFPESISSYLNESILKRAQEDGLIKVKFYNPRDYAVSAKKIAKTYAERRVDDKPYGGGPGMVIEALPVIRAIEKAVGKKLSEGKKNEKRKNEAKKVKIIFFAPGATQFTNEKAEKFAKSYTDIVFVCGRYEGIDARIKKVFKMEDISVGPFVLTGGEVPAMILIDCISRQIKGVLGNFTSLEDSRIASSEVYTRPEVFEYKKKKYHVPKVLLSGNHKLIDEWRAKRAKTPESPDVDACCGECKHC